MATIIQYDYKATPGELRELEGAIRLRSAKEARIDAERLSVEVLAVSALKLNEEPIFFRADRAEVKLDGGSFDLAWENRALRKEHRTVYMHVRDSMFQTRRAPDPSRLTEVYRWPQGT